MRLISKMADRLLTAVVPEISAGACCGGSGTTYVQECSCPSGSYERVQNCKLNCSCKPICGACYTDHSISCK